MNALASTLASDPALPQRDRLLDTDEMAQMFSVQLGRDGPLKIGRCERVRAKYHVGSSLRVLYRVQLAVGSLLIAARAYPPGRDRQICRPDATPNSGPFRATFFDSNLNARFWTFPNDRKIASLRVLADLPSDLTHLLTAWAGNRLVAYTPETCATAQCLSRRMEILGYAKVYAGEEGWRCYRLYKSLHRNLAGCPQLRVPLPIAYSHPRRTLLLQAIPGPRVADLPAAQLNEGFRSMGAAVAWLHTLAVPDGVESFRRLGPDRLRRAAQIIGTVRPDVALPAMELSRELASHAPATDDVVSLHGDVHAKNGIVSYGATALIDLDQLSAGPAAADVGSLLALLICDRCVGAKSAAVQSELADAFISGYARLRCLPDTASLRWHTAAALLAERALRAVNRVRPDGLEFLPDILRSADEVLSGGGRP